ncbi:hypothetical protein HK096_005783 [Nowakowskiella sp. JEL0078]|nr:hypothetical protein HK096_005783 [Nowakowskiella sp. JEL0078]
MNFEKRIPKIRVVNRNNSDYPTCCFLSLKTIALLSASFYILVALTQLTIQWVRFFNLVDVFPHWLILVLMGDFNTSYLVAMIFVSVFLISFAGWTSYGIYSLARQNLPLIRRYCMGQVIFFAVEGFGQVIVMLDYFMSYGIATNESSTEIVVTTDATNYSPSQMIYHAFIIFYIGLSFVFTINLWRYSKHIQKQDYLMQKESTQKEYVHHVETAMSKFDEEKTSPKVKGLDEIQRPELAKENQAA